MGKDNHKYFILFLLYATLGCLVIVASIGGDWMFADSRIRVSIKDENKSYFIIFIGVAAMLLVIAIGILLVTQVISSWQNLTTLDTFLDGIE